MAANGTTRVFLSAGEASGDHYGAEIIAGLRERMPGAEFTGLGGTEMEAAGQVRVVRAEEVAHMGITEVIRHAPSIYAKYRRLVGSIRRARPDVAVLIDFPDVNFRLAKHLRRAGVPVVWFVSPQLWAWKRRRLRWVQERVDRMVVIFPFEAEFYRARGVKAEFVGHPLAALGRPQVDRDEYASVYGLDTGAEWIALLPGSRLSEIRNNLRVMLEGVNQLVQQQRGKQYELLVPVAQTISLDAMRAEWERVSGGAGGRVRLVRDARAALALSRAAVVASGTATVQALTIGTPFVVVYRVSGLTFWLAKRLVRYPEEISAQVDAWGNLPIAMPNLIAGRRIVPELLNGQFTAEGVAGALGPLLEDGPVRERMVEDLAEGRARLVSRGGENPIERVCGVVMEALGRA